MKRVAPMPRGAGDNRLPALAAEIKTATADARRHSAAAVESALQAGERLLEARSLCRRGEWLPWLANSAEISQRTAQVYMQLARYKDQFKSAGSADFTIEAAIEYARGWKDARQRQTEWAHRIAASWADASQHRREWVRCVGDAYEGFKEAGETEDAFGSWLGEATGIGRDFARKIPSLLAVEYDDEAWTDAMLADIAVSAGAS